MASDLTRGFIRVGQAVTVFDFIRIAVQKVIDIGFIHSFAAVSLHKIGLLGFVHVVQVGLLLLSNAIVIDYLAFSG